MVSENLVHGSTFNITSLLFKSYSALFIIAKMIYIKSHDPSESYVHD